MFSWDDSTFPERARVRSLSAALPPLNAPRSTSKLISDYHLIRPPHHVRITKPHQDLWFWHCQARPHSRCATACGRKRAVKRLNESKSGGFPLMRTLHLLHAEAIRSPPARRSFKSVRCIHRSSPAQTNNGRSRKPQAQHVSLYDELFPEEKDLAGTTSAASKDEDIEIPRLPLSDLEHFEPFYRRSGDSQYPATESTEASAQESAKQWNPAVLVLSRASKSLVDADFRRIAPKGRHIEEWTGLGDILKGAHQSMEDAPT